MSSASHSRIARLACHAIFCSFLYFILSTPQPLFARVPQSPDTPSTPEKPTPAPEKKDSAAPSQFSKSPKPSAVKPHRVITDEDISTRPSVPVAPGAWRRLKQLNRCDRGCFHDVEKQAISNFGYLTVYPRSTRQEMEDRLAADIEELRNDPKWQQLLLNMISARITYCVSSQEAAQRPENSPSHTPTRQEILEEEERARNYRQPPPGSYQSTSSAAMSYRWSIRPDPLKASFMVHQWMAISGGDCSTVVPSQDLQDSDDEDP